MRTEKSSAPEGEILALLAELMQGTETYIPLADITKLFIERHGTDYDRPITSRYVGNLLRKRLHLSTYKRHGAYVLSMTEKPKIDALCVRYGIPTQEDASET